MKIFFQYQNLKGLANILAGGIPNTRGRYRSPKWRGFDLSRKITIAVCIGKYYSFTGVPKLCADFEAFLEELLYTVKHSTYKNSIVIYYLAKHLSTHLLPSGPKSHWD